MNVAFRPAQINISFIEPSMGVSTGTPVAREYIGSDPYEGEYTVIPSNEAQILETKNLRMTDNVVINAIPQNYGLITWNGSTLTVS